jgi:hypothetical protein
MGREPLEKALCLPDERIYGSLANSLSREVDPPAGASDFFIGFPSQPRFIVSHPASGKYQVCMRIHEARHHHRTPAIDGLGLQPLRLCFESARWTDFKDVNPVGQYRALGDDPELRERLAAPRPERSRECEELTCVAKKE